MKMCQFCAEDVQDAAIKCRHCGSDLRPSVEPAVGKSTSRAEPERTLYETGLHWSVFFRPTLWLIPAFLMKDLPVLPVFFVLVAVVDVGGRLLMRSNTHFKLTTRRLSMSTGTLRKRSLELMLSKVESISVNEPMFGRLFGYGTVVVGGTGGTKEPFLLVERPQEFRTRVQEQLVVVTQ